LENIVYSDSRFQKTFSFFLAVLCVLAPKLAKNANVTPKIFFSQHFDVDVKNAKFDADFKSIGKSVKKFL
jgi:hypothetical protein